MNERSRSRWCAAHGGMLFGAFALLALPGTLAGCGSSDAPASSMTTSEDGHDEAGTEAAPPEAGADVDAGRDAMADASPDRAVEAMPDSMPDARPDPSPDARPDVMPDAATDAHIDELFDVDLCVNEPPAFACVGSCLTDVVSPPVCRSGGWTCPAGTMPTSACPPGTCFVLPSLCCPLDGGPPLSPHCDGPFDHQPKCPAGTVSAPFLSSCGRDSGADAPDDAPRVPDAGDDGARGDTALDGAADVVLGD